MPEADRQAGGYCRGLHRVQPLTTPTPLVSGSQDGKAEHLDGTLASDPINTQALQEHSLPEPRCPSTQGRSQGRVDLLPSSHKHATEIKLIKARATPLLKKATSNKIN